MFAIYLLAQLSNILHARLAKEAWTGYRTCFPQKEEKNSF